MHEKTAGFTKTLYPDFITDGTYGASCAPFSGSYIYSQDWRNYKWGWLNDTGKYTALRNILDLNKFIYKYHLIKPQPFVPLAGYIELIDIPIPRESLELNVYIHSTSVVLDKDKHFAGSAVWFGINRDKIECHRCTSGRTNIKIDIETYVLENGITTTNLDNFVIVLQATGSSIKTQTGYQTYNMADIVKDGSYKVVL